MFENFYCLLLAKQLSLGSHREIKRLGGPTMMAYGCQGQQRRKKNKRRGMRKMKRGLKISQYQKRISSYRKHFYIFGVCH